MNAETFKKLAGIVSERGYIIDFDTKKHMIEICAEFDDNGQINFDDDQHWTIFVGDKCYIDEEITRAMLRKADYIEESSGNGWSFYIGRNCSEDVLADAFEATLGWALNCAAESGELTNAQLDEIETAGVELEFASRNREWNNEDEDVEIVSSKAPENAEIVNDKVSEETKSIIRDICALAREAWINHNKDAEAELEAISEALEKVEAEEIAKAEAAESDEDARDASEQTEPAIEIEDAERSDDAEDAENEHDVEAAPGFGTTYTISVNGHHYRTDDNPMGVWNSKAEAVSEIAQIQARYARNERDACIILLRNGVEIMRASDQDTIEIEDCELNPRRTKKEVLDNFQKWGGSLKIWNGSAWTFGNDADWRHAKFIQLIDTDGGGEHWRSPKLSGEDYAHFTLMMAAEMQRQRQTVTLP